METGKTSKQQERCTDGDSKQGTMKAWEERRKGRDLPERWRQRDQTDQRDPRDQETRETREAREARKARETREAGETRETRETRETNQLKEKELFGIQWRWNHSKLNLLMMFNFRKQ